MWLLLAFCSAGLLGFYDVFKKKALSDNAVIPVLFFNTLFSSLIFLPFIVGAWLPETMNGALVQFGNEGWETHRWVILKAFLVLGSWICGYYAIKNLPITIVGPVNATRPVLVLIGALLIFQEHLNGWQWAGVVTAMIGILLLSKSSKREGIDFKNNKWIALLGMAVVLGAASGLYDKYLMRWMNPLFVQAWFNVYQLGIMSVVLMCIWWPKRKESTPFKWNWYILLIPIFICAADFFYYRSLANEDAMISVVSMVRRGSVLISFMCGALLFHEKNLKSKAFDLGLIALSMILLYLGS